LLSALIRLLLAVTIIGWPVFGWASCIVVCLTKTGWTTAQCPDFITAVVSFFWWLVSNLCKTGILWLLAC